MLKAESLAMVATDGHRLSFVEKPGETLEGISGEKRVLIPRKALQELQQLLANTDVDKVEFADDEHTLFFRVGHRTLSTRRLSGQFPNYEAVMPRDNTKFVVVRSSELSAAIQRVAQFADERSGAIRLRLEGNELKISSQSTESGESEDTIDTPYAGEPIMVGFNSAYILEFLKSLGNEGEVRLEFKDSQSAGQIRPEDPDAEYQLAVCADADANLKRHGKARVRNATKARQRCRAFLSARSAQREQLLVSRAQDGSDDARTSPAVDHRDDPERFPLRHVRDQIFPDHLESQRMGSQVGAAVPFERHARQ